MTENPPLIDSNVFAYVHDEREPVKRKIAESALEKHWGDGFISQQVLGETYSVLTRKKRIHATTALAIISDMQAGFVMLTYTASDVIEAVQLNGEFGVSLRDGVLAATAKRFGISRILTENTDDFKKISGIHAENPFKT